MFGIGQNLLPAILYVVTLSAIVITTSIHSYYFPIIREKIEKIIIASVFIGIKGKKIAG